MERETGLEPATSSLGSWHSTTELLPLSFVSNYLPETKCLSPWSRQSIQSTESTSIYLVGPQNGQHNGQHDWLYRRRCYRSVRSGFHEIMVAKPREPDQGINPGLAGVRTDRPARWSVRSV